MTSAVFSLAVATFAIILKIVFAWATHEDARLERQERRRLKAHKPDSDK